jgi:glycosyltransferase involved in cell wall biosynthesis
MDISVIVPLKNEEESLPELAAWIDRVMKENNFSYEVWMIDDGSTDTSWNVIQQLAEANPNIKGIKFQRNYGKSAALNEGFKAAQGQVMITMDADLQDSPDEIPELYRMIKEDGYDIVSGWKKKRYDNALAKNLPSKLTPLVNMLNTLSDPLCSWWTKGNSIVSFKYFSKMFEKLLSGKTKGILFTHFVSKFSHQLVFEK